MRRLVVGLIFLVTWGLTTHGKYSVTGDEPHYLIVAESLRADGDLDPRNNYDQNGGERFGSPSLQPGPHARVAASGRFLPVHDVGVPVLLVPVYTAAITLARLPGDALLRRMRMTRGLFAYALIALSILCLSTTAAGVTITALERAGAQTGGACAIVAVAWLSPPIISNAFLVFPEPFALFVTACAVSRSVAHDSDWQWRDSTLILMLGALPWLHRKFAFYAIALLAILAWRRAAALRRLSAAARARLVLLFAIPPLILGAWTWREWGHIGGPLTMEGLPFSRSAFAHGIVGMIVDRENGLIWWAPVYALAPAAWWLRRRDATPWLIAIAALAVPAAAHLQWWGGFSPAGRFLVPLAPIACLIAIPTAEHRVLRYAALALLVPQAILTAYAWQHARLLWPQGDGENRLLAILLPPLDATYRAIPSFRTAPDAAWPAALVLLAAIVVVNVALVLGARRQYSMK